MEPRERAMLDFAFKVNEMKELSESDFNALNEHGFSREDAWDIGAVVAFFCLANRMAHLTAAKPDKPLFGIARK